MSGRSASPGDDAKNKVGLQPGGLSNRQFIDNQDTGFVHDRRGRFTNACQGAANCIDGLGEIVPGTTSAAAFASAAFFSSAAAFASVAAFAFAAAFASDSAFASPAALGSVSPM
jgi:hypothetical protein